MTDVGTPGASGSAVVLLSGGLDSGIAMALALAAGVDCRLAITADYGQRSRGAELNYARRLAERAAVPWQSLALPWLGHVAASAGCALMPEVGTLPIHGTLQAPGDAASAAAVWVPARNVILLAVAAGFAEALGADQVIAGFNAEEAATFADNSAEFVQHFNAVLRLGTRRTVVVISPTLVMDKSAIVAAGKQLGFTAADFWSCYGQGPSPCQKCESCLRSARAWSSQA